MPPVADPASGVAGSPARFTLLFDRFVRAVETGLALLLIGAILLNFVNVGGRYVFNYSVTGADEIQIYCIVCITFIGLLTVTWRRKHLRMDVMVRNAPPWIKTSLDVAERILTVALAMLLVGVSGDYAWNIFTLGSISENARIPMWIPHAAVTLGAVLLMVVALLQMGALLRRKNLPEPAPTSVDLQ